MSSPVILHFSGVEFEVMSEPGRPSFFLFGVRKSGSSIMNAMITSLARMNALHYVDVAGRLFEQGVSVATWQRDAGMRALLHGGNVYGGFRNAPLGLLRAPGFAESPQILLVRDPRDALVSEYFSNAYSHSLPQRGEARAQMLAERERAQRVELGAYVMRMAPQLRDTLREYAPFLAHPGLRLYRYETAILDKRWFLKDVCAHFGWTVTDQQLDLILGWADVMPEEERPTEFVRKVIPGDHRDKLDAVTITQLDTLLRAEMRLFGYV